MTDVTGHWPKWAKNLVKVGVGALAIEIGVAATVATGGAATPLFGQSGGGVQWWISVLG